MRLDVFKKVLIAKTSFIKSFFLLSLRTESINFRLTGTRSLNRLLQVLCKENTPFHLEVEYISIYDEQETLKVNVYHHITFISAEFVM